MTLPDNDRLRIFFAKCQTTESGCLIWRGKKKKGYSWIRYRGREYLGHRLIWKSLNGDIPNSTMVCHKCDEPLCINPEHLFLGDAKANVADMLSKGRAFWQYRRDGIVGHKGSRLTEKEYEWMFLSKEIGLTNSQIGRILGHNAKWVQEVLNGKTFKHKFKITHKPE